MHSTPSASGGNGNLQVVVQVAGDDRLSVLNNERWSYAATTTSVVCCLLHPFFPYCSPYLLLLLLILILLTCQTHNHSTISTSSKHH